MPQWGLTDSLMASSTLFCPCPLLSLLCIVCRDVLAAACRSLAWSWLCEGTGVAGASVGVAALSTCWDSTSCVHVPCVARCVPCRCMRER